MFTEKTFYCIFHEFSLRVFMFIYLFFSSHGPDQNTVAYIATDKSRLLTFLFYRLGYLAF